MTQRYQTDSLISDLNRTAAAIETHARQLRTLAESIQVESAERGDATFADSYIASNVTSVLMGVLNTSNLLSPIESAIHYATRLANPTPREPAVVFVEAAPEPTPEPTPEPEPMITPAMIASATEIKTYLGKTGCACGCGGDYTEGPGAGQTRRIKMINEASARGETVDIQTDSYEDIFSYDYVTDSGLDRVVRVYLSK